MTTEHYHWCHTRLNTLSHTFCTVLMSDSGYNWPRLDTCHRQTNIQRQMSPTVAISYKCGVTPERPLVIVWRPVRALPNIYLQIY